MKSSSPHLTLRRRASIVFVLAALLYLVGLILAIMNRSTHSPADLDSPSALVGQIQYFTLFTFSIVGVLISLRQPRNAISWLLLGVGFSWGLYSAIENYVLYGAFTDPGSLPAVEGFAAVGGVLWIFPILLMGTYLILLYPDGKLPSPRWRWLPWTAAIAGTLTLVSSILLPGSLEDSGFSELQNPFGVEVLKPFLEVLQFSFLLIPMSVLASAIALILRFRRSRGVERMQLKWLAAGGAVVATAYGGLFVTGALTLNETPVYDQVEYFSFYLFALIPVSIGIAILKYRLYDIDVVINKTLVFGSLAAFITAVYVAIVVGLGTALGSSDEPNLALSIAATAIVAIAFQPVKDRVQRIANRLVYGHRQTPYEVLSDFSAKVASSYETEEVTPAMAQTLKEATNAARADVWLAIDGSLVRAASHPPESFEASTVSLNGAGLPAIEGADHAVAVTHQQELLGALSVTKDPGDPLSAADHKLLDDLSAQAGIVLRNSRLTAELRSRLEQISVQAKEIRSSRQRIVSTQDKERRRLERDIHDGAQQHLVALAVKLRLAKTMTERKPERAHAMLKQLKTEMKDALDTLSDLASGIYPPLLKDKGIGPALAARADIAPFEVAIHDTTGSRFDPSVEAAVYFCCLEALQNTAKYAQATHATITLIETEDTLGFVVTDDGKGFDPATTSEGTGTQGMADRLAAVGGTLTVTSAPGEGTTVTGVTPLNARALK